MIHRIAGHSINLGDGVDVLNAEDIAQRAHCHLSGASLFTGCRSTEGENASGTHTEHSADDSLFAHAKPDHEVVIAGLLQELHHRDVVAEIRRRGHELVEISVEALHAL